MEIEPNPLDEGFSIPKQDIGIGDQVNIFLTLRNYDTLKYGFCDRYGYRLAESALALKKCGDRKVVVYDGVQTKADLLECYDAALWAALSKIPLDDRDIWTEEFQRELNEVHDMAVAIGFQGYEKE